MAVLLFYRAAGPPSVNNWIPVNSTNVLNKESSTTTTTKKHQAQQQQPPIISQNSSMENDDIDDDDDDDDTIDISSNALRYSCPATVTLPENLLADDDASSNNSRGIHSPHTNTSAYLSVFRNMAYDERYQPYYTYNDVKQSMTRWKTTRFGDYLHDGDWIYESGCGIGLNLVMTLEILYESSRHNIQNLHVYGNDYSTDAIRIAHQLLKDSDDDANSGGILSKTSGGGQLGKLCRADSSKLHDFMPSDTFDLVFSGYITPLQDALHLNLSATTPEDLDRAYRVICQEDATFLRAAEMQRRQEDWFAKWVSEMIRIAKPGAPVIVEQVSYPYCDSFYIDDWGGVAKDFWKSAVQRYQWDINVDSIEIENDSLMTASRYHVFMRKNNQSMT
jgi:hypothetical protein